jgi:hypothetical protein
MILLREIRGVWTGHCERVDLGDGESATVQSVRVTPTLHSGTATAGSVAAYLGSSMGWPMPHAGALHVCDTVGTDSSTM